MKYKLSHKARCTHAYVMRVFISTQSEIEREGRVGEGVTQRERGRVKAALGLISFPATNISDPEGGAAIAKGDKNTSSQS